MYFRVTDGINQTLSKMLIIKTKRLGRKWSIYWVAMSLGRGIRLSYRLEAMIVQGDRLNIDWIVGI